MAISLVKCAAFGEDTDDRVTNRGTQVCKMVLIGTNADVSYDIADPDGTFWADVDGTAAGLAAKTLVTSTIPAAVQSFIDIEGDFTMSYLRGAAAASGVYTLSVTNMLPTITFDTADAPVSMVIVLKWSLADGAAPITSVIA